MFYTDDPLADFERHDTEREAALEELPECCDCGEKIQQDTAVYINGEWLCDSCLDSYRRDVGDY